MYTATGGLRYNGDESCFCYDTDMRCGDSEALVYVRESYSTNSDDVNLNDEDVNILDVISINKTIFGKHTMNSYGNLAADINKNRTSDASNSLSIMKYIIGITDTLAE